MNISAIIAEYNPFHNGHKYHIEQTRKYADGIICILSSNFVQRGEPSIVNKFARTKMALENGVDLVVELPTAYSCSCGEHFAKGAISIINGLNIVDTLSFGCENQLDTLYNIINILENKHTQSKIKSLLKEGKSYPSALGDSLLAWENIDVSAIKKSNNILAIEYIKALNATNSTVKPRGILRKNCDHNSSKTVDNFASASHIRKLILGENDVVNFMPTTAYNILKHQINSGFAPVTLSNLDSTIMAKFRQGISPKITDVREGIENRIKEISIKSCNLQETIKGVKTPRYTYATIRRIAINTLLQRDFGFIEPQYIRVLGATKRGREMLKVCKEKSTLPIITKTGSFDNKMFDFEVSCGNLYSLLYPKEENRRGNEDLLTSPIMI